MTWFLNLHISKRIILSSILSLTGLGELAIDWSPLPTQPVNNPLTVEISDSPTGSTSVLVQNDSDNSQRSALCR